MGRTTRLPRQNSAALSMAVRALVPILMRRLGGQVEAFNRLPRKRRKAKLKKILQSRRMWGGGPVTKIAAAKVAKSDMALNLLVDAIGAHGRQAVAAGKAALKANPGPSKRKRRKRKRRNSRRQPGPREYLKTGRWAKVGRKHYRHHTGAEVRYDSNAWLWRVLGGELDGDGYKTASAAMWNVERVTDRRGQRWGLTAGPGGVHNPRKGRKRRRRGKRRRIGDMGHKPPKAVARAAKRGLALRRKHGRGGTAIGVARARDLSNRRPVSARTLRRMRSYFARHEVDRKAPGWGRDSAGWIAWLLWGGNAGRRWAKAQLRKLDKRSNPARPVAVGSHSDGYMVTVDPQGRVLETYRGPGVSGLSRPKVQVKRLWGQKQGVAWAVDYVLLNEGRLYKGSLRRAGYTPSGRKQRRA